MTKYVAIGHHGPMTPEEGLAVAVLQVPWLEERMADGSIDHVWALDGGGRVLIGNAESEAEFRELLASGPDAPSREWTRIAAIHDAVPFTRAFIENAGVVSTDAAHQA
jgi:hypothetical protein